MEWTKRRRDPIEVFREIGLHTPVIMELGAGPFLTCRDRLSIAKELILVDAMGGFIDKYEKIFAEDKSFTGKLTTHKVAVSGKRGTLEMLVSPAYMRGEMVGMGAGWSIVKTDDPDPKHAKWDTVTVECVTFDMIDPGNIDALYLDVEGHELEVLRHMVSRPKWMCVEIWHKNPAKAETLELLHDYGYRLRRQMGWDFVMIHEPKHGEVPPENR